MNGEDHDRVEQAVPGVESERAASPGAGGRSFEIHVKGHLHRQWSDWLGGLEMRLLDNGEMILSGPIVDQAALLGILNKLVGLNLTLLSFHEVNAEQSEEP